MTPQELKNSILQLAIQGKLVEQRPEEGTAEELYQQIQEEKQKLIREGKIKKEKPLPEITEEEKPFDIPENWKWTHLDDLVSKEIKRGKSPVYTASSNVLVFAQKCNTKVGHIDMNLALCLDEEKLIKYPETEFMRDMDIVINSTGNGTLGRVGIYRDTDNPDRKPVVPDSHVTVIRANDSLCTKYIYFGLKYYQPYMEKLGSGSTNQTELSANIIKMLVFPLPPIAEQRRIVAKIEELLPLIDRYEKAWSKLEEFNKQFPGDMQKSILQMAIQGKLVEQRPEEGTGEELYQQIQIEKQILIKEGKIKKDKSLPEITEEEKSFDIPESWKWVRIGSISQLNPKNCIDDDQEVAFIPMAYVSDGYKSEHSFEVRKWKDIKSGFTHFANNDIGIAKITPCFQNRKSVIFQNLKNGYGAGTTELSIVRPVGEFLSREYLLWFFKSEYFIANGMKSFTGTAGQQRIHKDYLAMCCLPLPPLAEQERITTELETILLFCKDLERYIN